MLLDDPTYQIFATVKSQMDRTLYRNQAGGGISFYVHNKFKAKILYCSQTTKKEKPMKPEYLFCTVWEGNSPSSPLGRSHLQTTDVNIRTDPMLSRLLRSTSSEFSN